MCHRRRVEWGHDACSMLLLAERSFRRIDKTTDRRRVHWNEEERCRRISMYISSSYEEESIDLHRKESGNRVFSQRRVELDWLTSWRNGERANVDNEVSSVTNSVHVGIQTPRSDHCFHRSIERDSLEESVEHRKENFHSTRERSRQKGQLV